MVEKLKNKGGKTGLNQRKGSRKKNEAEAKN